MCAPRALFVVGTQRRLNTAACKMASITFRRRSSPTSHVVHSAPRVRVGTQHVEAAARAQVDHARRGKQVRLPRVQHKQHGTAFVRSAEARFRDLVSTGERTHRAPPTAPTNDDAAFLFDVGDAATHAYDSDDSDASGYSGYSGRSGRSARSRASSVSEASAPSVLSSGRRILPKRVLGDEKDVLSLSDDEDDEDDALPSVAHMQLAAAPPSPSMPHRSAYQDARLTDAEADGVPNAGLFRCMAHAVKGVCADVRAWRTLPFDTEWEKGAFVLRRRSRTDFLVALLLLVIFAVAFVVFVCAGNTARRRRRRRMQFV